MNRTPTGVDRQRTNLYWPEEENSPSIHEFSPSRHLRRPSSRDSSSRTSSISYDSQNSFCDDVNTRELVRKQQASKIQFYDYDDTYVAPSRTITPSSVSRCSPEADVPARKQETLKSRIEFYDYVDGGGGGKKERPSESRQLARESAANGARGSNGVRETYAPEDRTYGRTLTTTTSARRTPINHNGTPHNQQQQQQRQGGHNHSQKSAADVRRETDLEKSRPNSRESQRQSVAKKQLSTSVIDLSTLDLDDPELEELKRMKQPPSKNDIHKKLATFHTEIRNANSRSADSYDSSPPRTTIIRTTLADSSPAAVNTRNQSNGMRQTSAAVEDDRRRRGGSFDGRSRDPVHVVRPVPLLDDPEPPNEARRMAHRHLQSSFSFGAEATPPPASQMGRRASIRDSAVSRVGVGLPDL